MQICLMFAFGEIVHINPYGLAHVFDFQDANFLDIRIWKIVHVNP